MNARFFRKPINAPLILFCISCATLIGCGGSSNQSAGEKTLGASGTILRSSVAADSAVSSTPSTTIENSSANSVTQQSSAAAIISKKDTVSPTAPESISKVILDPQHIELNWSASSDDVGVLNYKIYRNQVLIATVDANVLTYTDSTTKPNTLYTYSVIAGDSAGNWSELKSLLTQTPSVAASSSSTQIIVDESSSVPAVVSSTPKSTQSKSSSSSLTAVSSKASSLVTSSKKSSSPSSASVSSVSSSIQSKSSAKSSASSGDKEAPKLSSNIVKKALTETSVNLSWSAATDNVGVTGYKIYRDQALVATLDANQLSYAAGALKQNSNYTFAISAGDAANNWSSPVSLSLKTLKATGVTLKWLIPTERENGKFIAPIEIAGYEIKYKLKTDADFTSVFIKNGLTETYTFPTLDGDYEFKIAAYDVNEFYSDFVAIHPL